MNNVYNSKTIKVVWTMEDGSKVEFKPSDEDPFTGYNECTKGYEIEEDSKEE